MFILNLSKFISDCWKEHLDTHLKALTKDKKVKAKQEQLVLPVKKKEILEQAAFACADGNLPANIFANPSMNLLLEKLGKIRDETSPEAYKLILEQMKSRKTNINCLETLSESFKMVSFRYFSSFFEHNV